ncbi:glycosyltransferase family 4 protein [Synoicihabitans lomoniglobus]|uniref:Glycosyltransferase family 1 protein n=1 Tax=Synoicihabitans lomoniglobus TaxID=2909285 RepID=A0AAF0CSL2_9BACT|nr:glycosyltransferase family 4 protein [Opitutaceae bacterium LMO-M01]WED67358.1 glycosyltransferase family 1 protein [Opitutaceae bacterium LMO-M01]
MKIGLDLAQSASTRAGGGRYAQTLLEAMARLPHNDEFICYRSFANWINPPESIAKLPNLSRGGDPQDHAKTESVIREWREALATGDFPGTPEIVHATSFQAPRVRNAALVVSIFDFSFWAVPQFTTDRIRYDCQQGVLDSLAHANGLIFISEHARGEFDHFIPNFERKAKVKSAVIPLASFLPRLTKLSNEGTGEFWLFVGTQEPRKNLQTLLTAFERYVNQVESPLALWIAGGEGWLESSWQEQLRRLESRGLVRRLGYVSDAELVKFYRKARALFLPSWYEGFGLPVIEAMSQGCPVVCSNRTSLPEIAGRAAILLDPSQPTLWTEALIELHDHDERREDLATNGMAQASKFSWENTAKLTRNFYEEVLASHKGF